MDLKTSYMFGIRHMITGPVGIIFILCFYEQGSSSLVGREFSSKPLSAEHSNKKSCGGTLYASLNAQMIDFPQTRRKSETIYCEWTILSKNPSFTIGIAPVEHFLNYYAKNFFTIDVYDGPSAASKSLLYWHGMAWHERKYGQPFWEPKTSTSNIVFINYTVANEGPMHLDAKLVYYLCGGRVESEISVGSPVFNVTSSYSVPTVLQCSWTFVKPANALYGYIHFYTVQLPYCEALRIISDRGQLITIYRSNATLSTPASRNGNGNGNGTDLFATEREDWMQHYLSDDEFSNKSASVPMAGVNSRDPHIGSVDEKALTGQEMLICNSSIEGVLFNASEVTLTFLMVYPEKLYGFKSVYYHVLDLPNGHHVHRSSSIQNNWLRTYGAIIFLPLGVVIGVLIICSQQRTWKTFSKSVLNHQHQFVRTRAPLDTHEHLLLEKLSAQEIASQTNKMATHSDGTLESTESIANCSKYLDFSLKDESCTSADDLRPAYKSPNGRVKRNSPTDAKATSSFNDQDSADAERHETRGTKKVTFDIGGERLSCTFSGS